MIATNEKKWLLLDHTQTTWTYPILVLFLVFSPNHCVFCWLILYIRMITSVKMKSFCVWVVVLQGSAILPVVGSAVLQVVSTGVRRVLGLAVWPVMGTTNHCEPGPCFVTLCNKVTLWMVLSFLCSDSRLAIWPLINK